MKTIKFYTDSNKYMGWKKVKSFCENWFECKSWINSGNYLIIDGITVSTFDSNLKAALLNK